MRTFRGTFCQWRAATAALVCNLGWIASPAAHGAGVAAFKDQPFHSDELVQIIVYSKITEGAASYLLDLGTKELPVDRSKIVGYVTVPELPANLRDAEATAQIRQSLETMSAFAQRFKKAAPVLKPYIEQMTTVLGRLAKGEARFEGRWISKEEHAGILRREMAARQEAQELEEKRRLKVQKDFAFAAEQRAKGLERYNGEWLPAGQVEALRKKDAQWSEAYAQVDEKSVMDMHYKVLEVVPEGMLIHATGGNRKPPGINLDLVYLYNANNGTVAEGDLYHGDVFWSGTRTFNTKEGRMTLHTYRMNRNDAVAEVHELLYGKGPKDDPPGPGPDMVRNPPPDEDIPELLRAYDGFGSGFFIGEEGYFVTNAHVVGKALEVDIYYEEKKARARVLHVNKTADLAVLKADIAVSGLVITEEEAEPGTDIYVVGFPRPTLQGIDVKVTKGIVSSKRGLRNDASRFQIDAAIQPGNSGGALCDDCGRVRGVVVSMLSHEYVLERSGTLPQNVNYAIKTSELAAFLRSKSVKFQQTDDSEAQGPRGVGVRMVCAASGLVLVKE